MKIGDTIITSLILTVEGINKDSWDEEQIVVKASFPGVKHKQRFTIQLPIEACEVVNAN